MRSDHGYGSISSSSIGVLRVALYDTGGVSLGERLAGQGFTAGGRLLAFYSKRHFVSSHFFLLGFSFIPFTPISLRSSAGVVWWGFLSVLT